MKQLAGFCEKVLYEEGDDRLIVLSFYTLELWFLLGERRSRRDKALANPPGPVLVTRTE